MARVLNARGSILARLLFSNEKAYLHWLSLSQRNFYRIAGLVWQCLAGCAPYYLTDLCRPVSDLASRQALHPSSARGELLVPRAQCVLKQRGAFSVIGPSPRNQLSLTVR